MARPRGTDGSLLSSLPWTLAALAVFEILMDGSIPPEPMWSHLAIEAYRSVAWERDDLLADRASAPQTWQQLLAKDTLAGRVAAVDPDAAGTWPGSIGGPGGTAAA